MITTGLMAGLQPPEIKTSVATALDIKRGSWGEHPDLVYSVAREAAVAWAIIEQADKLRRVPSRVKGVIAGAVSAKEEKAAGKRRGGQGSSARGRFRAVQQLLKLRKGVLQHGRLYEQAELGPQEDNKRPLLSLVVQPLASNIFSSKVLSKERARHPMRPKTVRSEARVAYAHARRFLTQWATGEDLDISTTVVPPVSWVPSQRRQPPEAGAPVPA